MSRYIKHVAIWAAISIFVIFIITRTTHGVDRASIFAILSSVALPLTALYFLPLKFAAQKAQQNQVVALLYIALVAGIPLSFVFIGVFVLVGLWAWAIVLALKPDRAVSAVQPLPQKDAADEIERLAGLRDKGILTDAEFQSQKQRILAR